MSPDPRRPQKGLSLLELPCDYVLLDLETTGLDPKNDCIIEIGAVRVACHETVDRFSSLVRPPVPISSFITALTGISNSMVQDAAPIEVVLPAFMDFVGSSVVIGHNVNFDINFLYENCLRLFGHGFPNDFVDTLRLSRKLYPQERHHRLCDMEARFHLHNEQAHRALSDVILTKECYDAMRRDMEQRGLDPADLRSSLKAGYGRSPFLPD
ncbi:MAG: 3'-5' exonuclease [Lachnospiraceae bacterium]|nr:3'-5' exonuclease [Lachnospiraceae bacterium]